jgi:hypothetical protein
MLGKVSRVYWTEFKKQFDTAVVAIMKTAPELHSSEKRDRWDQRDQLGQEWQRMFSALSDELLPSPQAQGCSRENVADISIESDVTSETGNP